MAGQRASLETHREVSAVCTVPEERGRGLSAHLVSGVVRAVRESEGKTPFLHVDARNETAIAGYLRFGFEVSRDMHVTVVRRRD